MNALVSTLLRHIGSIIAAFLVWWSVAVLIGLALYQVWPLSPVLGDSSEGVQAFSFMAGVSLGRHWQNIPGNVLGFILALYAFRALCPNYRPANVKHM